MKLATVLKAVLVVDCVGFGVLVFEGFGYAGAPASFCIAGMDEKSLFWGGEDVAC